MGLKAVNVTSYGLGLGTGLEKGIKEGIEKAQRTRLLMLLQKLAERKFESSGLRWEAQLPREMSLEKLVDVYSMAEEVSTLDELKQRSDNECEGRHGSQRLVLAGRKIP